MSSLIVEVCKVDDVQPHPNADRMEVCVIKGWRTCVKKDQYKRGDLCIYIPPDAILPIPLADSLGVTKYLSPVKIDGVVTGARVRVTRLRGEPSYGLVMAVQPDSVYVLGDDLATSLNITKWEPPLECTEGDAATDNPAFHRYFTLENYLNFPDLIQDGEEVVITEKIHGKNCRVGMIREPDEHGVMAWCSAAGSHDVRRKMMCKQRKRRIIPETGEEEFYYVERTSQFWEAMDKPGVKELLRHLNADTHNVIVFGEIYGSGVQDMAYGKSNGQWDFRVFDITVDGKYLSWQEKRSACHLFKVEMVPVLYYGPFSKDVIERFVGGPTTVCEPDVAGTFKEREGIVITTVREHPVSHGKKFFDRCALKAINFKYLERKDGSEHH